MSRPSSTANTASVASVAPADVDTHHITDEHENHDHEAKIPCGRQEPEPEPTSRRPSTATASSHVADEHKAKNLDRRTPGQSPPSVVLQEAAVVSWKAHDGKVRHLGQGVPGVDTDVLLDLCYDASSSTMTFELHIRLALADKCWKLVLVVDSSRVESLEEKDDASQDDIRMVGKTFDFRNGSETACLRWKLGTNAHLVVPKGVAIKAKNERHKVVLDGVRDLARQTCFSIRLPRSKLLEHSQRVLEEAVSRGGLKPMPVVPSSYFGRTGGQIYKDEDLGPRHRHEAEGVEDGPASTRPSSSGAHQDAPAGKRRRVMSADAPDTRASELAPAPLSDKARMETLELMMRRQNERLGELEREREREQQRELEQQRAQRDEEKRRSDKVDELLYEFRDLVTTKMDELGKDFHDVVARKVAELGDDLHDLVRAQVAHVYDTVCEANERIDDQEERLDDLFGTMEEEVENANYRLREELEVGVLPDMVGDAVDEAVPGKVGDAVEEAVGDLPGQVEDAAHVVVARAMSLILQAAEGMIGHWRR